MATQTLSRFLIAKPKYLTSFRPFSSFCPAAAAASSVKTLITPSPPLPSPFSVASVPHLAASSSFAIHFLPPSNRSPLEQPGRPSMTPTLTTRPVPLKRRSCLTVVIFEHWLVVMEPPKEDTTRDDNSDSYIKTLAQVVGRRGVVGGSRWDWRRQHQTPRARVLEFLGVRVGSGFGSGYWSNAGEEEARMKIYSVSTQHYSAFGALVSEELLYKIKDLPGVLWVKNKDSGGLMGSPDYKPKT
ncbi:multiple organellar RNA editing factor 8, chloroplastic/mitochondrial-like [Hibiscus syriacus]|uniref:multiple organellar RNA editing factor 8, chloroplastic/mitochondrial-like n=1 Tax=Hibiscus syriacus TaxID=106335 RepID=UPI001924419D|nr:multiple organellar RNA editing factor 8, chloroplastic/mitochondrial-like [Hibiscus syriacus]